MPRNSTQFESIKRWDHPAACQVYVGFWSLQASVSATLSRPTNYKIKQQWCTKGWLFQAYWALTDIWRLLWLTCLYTWEEKLRYNIRPQGQTILLTFKKPPVLQVIEVLASKSTSHGGSQGSSQSIWTILQGRKLIAHSYQSGCWPPKFNSYFHFSKPA